MNPLSNLNLLSFLDLVSSRKIDEILLIQKQYPSILEILDFLNVISVTSSDSSLKVELTPLGSAILSNAGILETLKNQDVKLSSITSDLQRIKSALSAISLDAIRTQNLDHDGSYGSDLLSRKEENFQNYSKKPVTSSVESKTSKIASVANIEDFKQYAIQKLQETKQEQLEHQRKSLHRIQNSYNRVLNDIQQKTFQEAGLEAFLVLDSIFIFLLQFFGQKDVTILSSSLEKKYELLKELPLNIDPDVILFLDRFNADIQNKTDEPLTVGEKTAKKILSLINDIYKPFISIFEDIF